VLGVHWSTDVVVGILLGASWGVAVAVSARWVEWSDLRAALHPGRGRGAARPVDAASVHPPDLPPHLAMGVPTDRPPTEVRDPSGIPWPRGTWGRDGRGNA
jgi:hypothetical protein